MVIMYFFFVETRGPSLEEIAVVFDGEDALVGGTGFTKGEAMGLENTHTHTVDKVDREHVEGREHVENRRA